MRISLAIGEDLARNRFCRPPDGFDLYFSREEARGR
jgi:hypothetical protein